MKAKYLRKLLSVIALLVLVGLLITYIHNNWSQFQQLRLLSPIAIGSLIIIFIAFLWLNGLLLKSLVKPFGVNLSPNEAFGLSAITNFYNTITPFRGGAASRAIYLKNKHNFSYTKFLATLSATYVIIFFFLL